MILIMRKFSEGKEENVWRGEAVLVVSRELLCAAAGGCVAPVSGWLMGLVTLLVSQQRPPASDGDFPVYKY